MGSARNPLPSGKPFIVLQTIGPLATLDFPTTLRTKCEIYDVLAYCAHHIFSTGRCPYSF